jgi:hypothetical protein
MRRLAAFAALSIAALSALPAEAQTRSLRRSGEDVLILNVRPRSYLDAGNVVPVGSSASGRASCRTRSRTGLSRARTGATLSTGSSERLG